MEFFKREDFESYGAGDPRADVFGVMAGLANDKLEREGKVVYGGMNTTSDGKTNSEPFFIMRIDKYYRTHKALLINIEPIESCKHPKEKVSGQYADENGVIFKCKCGIRVRPKEFEEV